MLQEQLYANVGRPCGKSGARVLRRSGMTPAVLYGPKTDPVLLALETKEFTKTLLRVHGHNAVITLKIKDGESTSERHVMLKEIQTDPVTDTLIHTDFLEISLENKVTLPVALRYVGKAKGVDLGGDLHIVISEVTLTGRPLDLPDYIEVDVSSLDLGGSLTLGEVSIPESVEALGDKKAVCVSVTAPVAE